VARTPSVLVVGAGMAGLSAAGHLAGSGVTVTVLDKGRAVGGRMATRRSGDAVFDHGAQHFSVRTTPFAATIEPLLAQGVVRVWIRTPSTTRPDRGIEPRHVGVGGMRRVPEALSTGLTVATGVTVDRLAFGGDGVTAMARDTPVATADGAIVTAPVPQTIALLGASGIDPSGSPSLEGIGYDATLAVMAVLDRPASLPDGHRAFDAGPVAWMADNQHKGVSPVPALTIHSSPRFAARHLEDDPGVWSALLLDAARPHHEGDVVRTIEHRWRHAQPRTTRDDGAVGVGAPAPLVLAGEVFAGARVEGAFTSGRAAAADMLARIG
jgi:renalase